MRNKVYSLAIPAVAVLSLLSFLLLPNKQGNSLGLALLVLGTAPFLWQILSKIFKGKIGVDLIALVAIATSIILRQYFAGSVILLMLSGGGALEDYALARARKELTELVAGEPRIAHKNSAGKVIDIQVDQVRIGDALIVKPGEIIPVDGIVLSGNSTLNTAAITGESLPADARPGVMVYSGCVNQDGVIEVRAGKQSKDSRYQQIIRLVKQAEESKAPIVRLADSYTGVFTAITFVMSAAAWFIFKDPIRLLAVLVVATPCPLILATPIAVISGISKSARNGIIVKNGAALEMLGRSQAFVFDKTGTITLGQPKIERVEAFKSAHFAGSKQGVLRIAASLDQLSGHILAKSLVQQARSEVRLELPGNYEEFFGDGVSGNLDKKYFFGKLAFIEAQGVKVPPQVKEQHRESQDQGLIAVYLSDDSDLLGAVYFADQARPESKSVFDILKRSGLKKILMVTGDRAMAAERISKQIGIPEVIAEQLPDQKVAVIKTLQKQNYQPVTMVGDGVNDAAALATADIGITMGAHGSGASSEAGDIVVTVDNLAKVGEVYLIAKRMLAIALQGIYFGIGMSVGLMILAALGYIQPVQGAVLQEILDVLVIFNAMRVLV